MRQIKSKKLNETSLTQDKLKQLFDYDETGNLIWKINAANNVKIGDIAGSFNTLGYRRVTIDGKDFKAHRLIYLWHRGTLPSMLDHVDGNVRNNKIENLRPATYAENSRNSKRKITSRSGIKNVFWHKQANKWVVNVSIKGKNKYIGLYEDLECAKIAAQEARLRLHGEFARSE